MIYLHKFGALLFTLFAFFLPSHAISSNLKSVDSTDPVKLVKTLSERIFFVLKSQSESSTKDTQKIANLLEKELLPYVNIEHTTRLAFGRIWKNANTIQQKKLVDLFKKLLVRTYSVYIQQIKDQKIIILDNPLFSKDFVTVRSKVENINFSQNENMVLYRVEKTIHGWQVFDVQVAGAWLILTYRGQFNDMFNKLSNKSVDTLINEIKNKIGK